MLRAKRGRRLGALALVVAAGLMVAWAPTAGARAGRHHRIRHSAPLAVRMHARQAMAGRWHRARGIKLHARLLRRSSRLFAMDPFASVEPYAPPSMPVGANPSGIAVNPANKTVYVVNQADDTVSVIDGRVCNSQNLAGCTQPVATIRLGPGGLQNGPVTAVVSPDGGTLYIGSPGGANAIAVINATTCNATNTAGCAAQPVTTVATGNGPLGLTEDLLSHTLYVTNIGDNTVSLIDVSRCTAQQTSGCGQVAPTVPVGNAPVALALDARSRSLYVANIADDTVSVIDTDTCNAKHPSGCPASPPTQAVGGAPDAVAVSTDGGTVYVANSGNGVNGIVGGGSTVSLIDATACNGGHPQGCSMTPAPVVGVGGEQDDQPQSLAFDPATHDLYAANSSDDSVSVVDGRACSAGHLGGCPQTAADVQSGGQPNALADLPSEHTIYVVDGVDGAVAVISDRACTTTRPLSCRPASATATTLGRYNALASGATVDAADHTAYVINYGVAFGGPFVIDLINTSTCNAATTTGCVSPATNFAPQSTPNGVTVDPANDTLYLSEGGPGADQIEVIDGHHCNAADTTCAAGAVIPIDTTNTGTGSVVIDEATQTAYAYAFGPQQIDVIDISHCNATDTSGCSSQPVAHIPFADPVLGAGVAHDTLYADVLPNFDSTAVGYVGVFDTHHCRAGDTTGCAGLAPARVTVGIDPTSLAVDAAQKTVYVTDNANGDSAGLVSMIDTTHCSGDDSSGCSTQAPLTTPAGRSVLSASLDPSANTLYVANFSDASVFTYDTASCNAATQSGCPSRPPEVIVGSGPAAAAIDPGSQTVYVPNFWDGTVSLVPTKP